MISEGYPGTCPDVHDRLRYLWIRPGPEGEDITMIDVARGLIWQEGRMYGWDEEGHLVPTTEDEAACTWQSIFEDGVKFVADQSEDIWRNAAAQLESWASSGANEKPSQENKTWQELYKEFEVTLLNERVLGSFDRPGPPDGEAWLAAWAAGVKGERGAGPCPSGLLPTDDMHLGVDPAAEGQDKSVIIPRLVDAQRRQNYWMSRISQGTKVMTYDPTDDGSKWLQDWYKSLPPEEKELLSQHLHLSKDEKDELHKLGEGPLPRPRLSRPTPNTWLDYSQELIYTVTYGDDDMPVHPCDLWEVDKPGFPWHSGRPLLVAPHCFLWMCARKLSWGFAIDPESPECSSWHHWTAPFVIESRIPHVHDEVSGRAIEERIKERMKHKITPEWLTAGSVTAAKADNPLRYDNIQDFLYDRGFKADQNERCFVKGEVKIPFDKLIGKNVAALARWLDGQGDL